MYVIEHGGDIHFAGDREPQPADRIEIHESGWVTAINKMGYKKSVYPPHKIDGIHTHTSDEEEAADWW